MIPFSFLYCRPDTLGQAQDAYRRYADDGKKPLYYAGGSEIITMSRAGSIRPDAVIDIKSIPECRLFSLDEQGLHIGSACTLNQIKESKHFPLLGSACGRIADHTNQCRITLGGNLCGTILYRETSLPLLISDAKLSVLDADGLHTVPFREVFRGRMQIEPGSLIVQVHIPAWALQAPHFHVKHTANEKIDYPLVSMAALQKEGRLRLALSGVCPFPFRSEAMEAVLNDPSLPVSSRAEQAVSLLPESPLSDAEASGEYRVFVLQNMLQTLLEEHEKW